MRSSSSAAICFRATASRSRASRFQPRRGEAAVRVGCSIVASLVLCACGGGSGDDAAGHAGGGGSAGAAGGGAGGASCQWSGGDPGGLVTSGTHVGDVVANLELYDQ